MSYEEFKKLVSAMMEAQASYFICPRHEAKKKEELLQRSKALEAKVRKALQPDLFNNLP